MSIVDENATCSQAKKINIDLYLAYMWLCVLETEQHGVVYRVFRAIGVDSERLSSSIKNLSQTYGYTMQLSRR